MRGLRCFCLSVAACAAIGLSGCDSSSDVTAPAFDEQELESAALLAAMVAPSAGSAEQMMLDMASHMAPAAAPLSAGDSVSLPSHTETFDLGNGISGTMEFAATGVYTFAFAGALEVDGATIAVQGTLVLAPAADQPASGASHLIDFDAVASGPRGSATWSATGTLTRDAAGALVDYDATMTHTVTPTGGPTSVVLVGLSPTSFEVVVSGPRGNTLRFTFDRGTMSGMVSLNGRAVAQVTVSDGCAHVDYVDESRQDVDVCAAA